MNTSPIARLALGALIITLAGCEAAEESAQRLQEKAEQAVQEIAREAVSDTVQAFNKQVDDAQQAAEELLGRPGTLFRGDHAGGDNGTNAKERTMVQ